MSIEDALALGLGIYYWAYELLVFDNAYLDALPRVEEGNKWELNFTETFKIHNQISRFSQNFPSLYHAGSGEKQ